MFEGLIKGCAHGCKEMLLTLWIDGEISAKQAAAGMYVAEEKARSRSTRADAERVAASVLEEMDRDAELPPEEREVHQLEREETAGRPG